MDEKLCLLINSVYSSQNSVAKQGPYLLNQSITGNLCDSMECDFELFCILNGFHLISIPFSFDVNSNRGLLLVEA